MFKAIIFFTIPAGYDWSALAEHLAEHPLKPLLMVGILGALTTFSSFALDTVVLAQHGAYLKALLNIGLNLFLCLAMVMLGMQLVASRV